MKLSWTYCEVAKVFYQYQKLPRSQQPRKHLGVLEPQSDPLLLKMRLKLLEISLLLPLMTTLEELPEEPRKEKDSPPMMPQERRQLMTMTSMGSTKTVRT